MVEPVGKGAGVTQSVTTETAQNKGQASKAEGPAQKMIGNADKDAQANLDKVRDRLGQGVSRTPSGVLSAGITKVNSAWKIISGSAQKLADNFRGLFNKPAVSKEQVAAPIEESPVEEASTSAEKTPEDEIKDVKEQLRAFVFPHVQKAMKMAFNEELGNIRKAMDGLNSAIQNIDKSPSEENLGTLKEAVSALRQAAQRVLNRVSQEENDAMAKDVRERKEVADGFRNRLDDLKQQITNPTPSFSPDKQAKWNEFHPKQVDLNDAIMLLEGDLKRYENGAGTSSPKEFNGEDRLKMIEGLIKARNEAAKAYYLN